MPNELLRSQGGCSTVCYTLTSSVAKGFVGTDGRRGRRLAAQNPGSGFSRERLGGVSGPLSPVELRWLRKLTTQAFLIRAAVAMALHFLDLSNRFAPDEVTYLSMGTSLARYWSGDVLLPPQSLLADQPTGYFYLNAVALFVFGSILPLKFLNCFLGAQVCRFQYYLGRAIFGIPTARRGALLTAFLPSLVLWSALNIRDVWAIFLVLFISWKSYQLIAGYSHLALLQLLASIAALTMFRQYLFFVVALPPIVGLVVGSGRRNTGRNFVLAALASVGILTLAELGMARQSFDLMSLEALAEAREGMQYGAGSAFGGSVDISTPAQALRYLPVGIAYFLFSPFPWDITSALKAASLPEILLLYWLTPHTFRGARFAVRHRLGDTAQILVLTALLIVSYSLGSGNVGTLYRHRAQALPLLLLLAAVGWELKRGRLPREPLGERSGLRPRSNAVGRSVAHADGDVPHLR